MADHHITFSDEMSAYLEAQVATGFFASPDEYIETLVQRDQRENGSLRELLAEGERSGVGEFSHDEIVERARSKAKSPAS